MPIGVKHPRRTTASSLSERHNRSMTAATNDTGPSERPNVVHEPLPAIHRHADAGYLQATGEAWTGELAALIPVEDPRPVMPGQGLVERLRTEARVKRDRQPPGQHIAAGTARYYRLPTPISSEGLGRAFRRVPVSPSRVRGQQLLNLDVATSSKGAGKSRAPLRHIQIARLSLIPTDSIHKWVHPVA